MDTFLPQFRRLIRTFFVAFVFLFFGVLSSSSAAAPTATESQQHAACVGWVATYEPPANVKPIQNCVAAFDPISGYNSIVFSGTVIGNGAPVGPEYFDYSGAPDNPCSALQNSSMDIVVPPGGGSPATGSTTVTDPATGLSTSCPFSISYSGVPHADAYGHYHQHVTTTYSGNPGTSGATGAVGSSTYDGVSGQPLTPQPVVTPGASPQLCGGGSCYDPNTNTYTVVGPGGTQITVSGSVADSSGGGCASSGAATMCGGSPTPPSPVGQSGSSITDPATQIQSSDNYPTQNPSTGVSSSTTVNVYSSGGATSSGSSSGSVSVNRGSSSSTTSGNSGPASASSSGNGDSFNGGGNCNTPPVCTGDAVMCGVAQETWQTSCDVTIQTTALAGNNPSQSPPTFSSDSTKYAQSDVWQQPSSGNTTGDQANSGTYDQTGFGYATSCPATDLSVSVAGGVFVVPFSKICVIGPWIYWTVIGFSLYRAARITAGSAV